MMRIGWLEARVAVFRVARGGRVTKWRGRVASIAPAVLAVGALLFAAPGVAQAGTCSLTPGTNTIVCSGAPNPGSNDPANSFTLTDASPIDVSFANSGDGIDSRANAGDALRLESNNSPTGIYLDASNASLIAGQDYGIYVKNYTGGGNIDIFTGGKVIGGFEGIKVENESGNEIFLEVSGVEIDPTQLNSGDDAIDLENDHTNTGDVTVVVGSASNPANIIGASDGIEIDSRSDGDIIVDVYGNIEAGHNTANNTQNAINIGAGESASYSGGAGNSLTTRDVVVIVRGDMRANDSGAFIKSRGTGSVVVVAGGDIGHVSGPGNKLNNHAIWVETLEAHAGTTSSSTPPLPFGVVVDTAAGKTIETKETGIYVRHAGEKGVSIVSAADIDADGGGIDVLLTKTGVTADTSINVSGTITSNNGTGVTLVTSNDGQARIDVSAAVDVDKSGLLLNHKGTGDAIIETSGAGTITAGGNGTGNVGIGISHEGTGNATINSNTTVTFGGTGSLEFAVGIDHSGTGNANVNVAANVTSAAHGVGIDLSGTGDANVDIADGVAINVARHGVYIDHSGTGNVNVTAGNGTIATNGGRGIYITTGANVTDVTLASNSTIDVTSPQEGVLVEHNGNGNTSVTIDGKVTASTAAAVSVNAGNTTKDTTIDVNNDLSGGTYGLYAAHNGTGDVIVTLDGQVEATSGAGVRIDTGNNAQNTTVDVNNTVTGSTFGVYVTHNGANDVTLTVDGEVTGGSSAGVRVDTGNNSNKVAIDINSNVTGGTYGVYAVHNGTNVQDITIDGDITGGSSAAIRTETNAGNTTNLTINTGTITAGSNGVAIANNVGDSVTTVASAAIVKGKITLGDGSDELNINGADVSQVTLFDGGDDTLTGDGYIDRLTFNGVTLNNANAGIFQNWEVFTLTNSTLTLASGTMGAGQVNVNAGSTLGFAGANVTIDGSVTNDGLITSQDNATGDTLTIKKDYAGTGSVRIDTFLDDGAVDTTDKVTIQGDNNGTIALHVTNTGGPGAYTGNGPTDGIHVVDVQGANNGSMTLANGPLVAGAYVYDLTNNGYLQSKPAGSATHTSTALLQLLPASSESFMERIASTMAFSPTAGGQVAQTAGFTITPTAATPVDMVSGLWLRGRYRYLKADADLTVAGAPFESTTKMHRLWMQFGYTHALVNTADGVLAGSIFGQYKRTTMDMNATTGISSDSRANGFGGGASLTWLDQSGFYGDLYGEVTRHNVTVRDATVNASTSINVTTWRISAEGGYRLPMTERLNLIPQVQLNVGGSKFASFNVGALSVQGKSSTRATGRLGLAAEFVNLPVGEEANLTAQFTASWLHDFTGASTLTVNGQQITSRLARDLVELRSSTILSMTGTGVSFMLENNFRHSLKGPKQYSFKTSVGVKVSF